MKADQGCLAYAKASRPICSPPMAPVSVPSESFVVRNRFAPEAFPEWPELLRRQQCHRHRPRGPQQPDRPRCGARLGYRIALRARAGGAGIALGPADDHPHPTLRSFAARRIRKTTTAAIPADEVALFSKSIRDFVEKVTALAHSAADPSAYATQLLARLCPGVLPYELDTPASFSFAAFNGRGLCDDVMDVILTLVTNTALGDGVAPDMRLMRPDFPYFGEPHVTAASSAKQ